MKYGGVHGFSCKFSLQPICWMMIFMEFPANFPTTEFSGSQDAFAQRYQVEAVDYAGRRECETFPVGVPHWHPLTV